MADPDLEIRGKAGKGRGGREAGGLDLLRALLAFFPSVISSFYPKKGGGGGGAGPSPGFATG